MSRSVHFPSTILASGPDGPLCVVAIMMRQQIVRDVPDVTRQVPVMYLPGSCPLTSSPLEFDASTKLMADAYEARRAFLAAGSTGFTCLYGAPPLVTALDQGGPPDVRR